MFASCHGDFSLIFFFFVFSRTGQKPKKTASVKPESCMVVHIYQEKCVRGKKKVGDHNGMKLWTTWGDNAKLCNEKGKEQPIASWPIWEKAFDKAGRGRKSLGRSKVHVKQINSEINQLPLKTSRKSWRKQSSSWSLANERRALNNDCSLLNRLAWRPQTASSLQRKLGSNKTRTS